jgi:hypothetical protein
MRRAAIALLVAAALAACSNDFEKQSQIVKLRVLGIRAEPAELIVAPGAPPPKTTFTALAATPDGGAASIVFALCTDQTNPPAADLDCPGAQGIALSPASSTSAVLDFGDPRLQELALQLASADGGIPDGGLAAGIPLIVGFEASSALADGGADVLRGLTTITAHDDSRPANRNPDLDALRTDAGDIDPDGGTELAAGAVERLTPVPAADAKETTPQGPEALSFSFFATAGSISSLRSTDTTATGQPADTFTDYTSPLDPQQVRLWVVVRDGRGGTGWLERSVVVR